MVAHGSCALKSHIKPPKGDPHNDPDQYAAVLQHMEHLASTSQKADMKGLAKYIAVVIKDIHFLAFCHFLADLFSTLETVSLKFQQNDLILPSAVSLPRETNAKVCILPKHAAPGGWLESFDKVVKKSGDKALFQGVTIVRSSHQKRGKESSDLQSKLDVAVELYKQGLLERLSNLLKALWEKPNKDKSTASTIVCDMLVFNVDAWLHDIDSLLGLGSDEVASLVTW